MDDIKELVEKLYSAPWWLLAPAFSFLICVAFRRWGKFPNRLIPLACLVLCSLLTACFAPHHPDNFTPVRWFGTNLMVGGILGFLIWGFHNQVLKRLAQKFPWLDGILTGGDGDDDTPVLTPPAKPDNVPTATTGTPANKP